MSDPFGTPRDMTTLFPAVLEGLCAEGCWIDPGDMIGYLDGDLLCERCYHEVRGT